MIDVNWTGIFDGIGRMFTGGTYTTPNGTQIPVDGIFGGGLDGTALLGILLFMFLLILTAMYGLGILIGSVAIIPSAFAVMGYIPEIKVILAIILGLIFGIGINRFVRR
jgi:hypothetical protein